jgi:DNA polymerase-3 subunit beta
MKVCLDTDTFRSAINKILTVVDKRNSRPILTYALIKADGNTLEISATDLEVSAKVCVEANVNEAGTFCVNAKNIFDILRELPDGEVHLEIVEGENTLKLFFKDIHYSLLVYKNEDFPQIVFNNQNNEVKMSSQGLLDVIGKTSYAISTDETRLYLNGIYLQERDSKLRAVATDGHRLSMVDTEVDVKGIDSLTNGIIIPKKGVYELKKLAESNPSAELKISLDDSFLYANSENTYYLSVRLIAREYPKYQAVIPSKTSFLLTADRDLLFNAVRRIKIMSNEKSNGVRIHLKDKEMTITANHPSLGDASEKLAVDYNGKDMEIGFNAKYLIDTLSIFNDGEVLMELNNELSPVIIRSSNSPNHMGIIMPLKL